jgi:hypothetical protein
VGNHLFSRAGKAVLVLSLTCSDLLSKLGRTKMESFTFFVAERIEPFGSKLGMEGAVPIE